MQPRLTVQERRERQIVDSTKTINDRRDARIINNLMLLAEDVEFGQSSRYRLASAIVKKRKILGYGINSYKKTHPLQAKFKKNDAAIYLCAETACIINSSKRFNPNELVGSTIYIVRIKYTDAARQNITTGLAYPCIGCQKRIKEAGISKFVYTTEGGKYKCESF